MSAMPKLLIGLAVAAVAAPALAQTPTTPAAGCSASPAQLEANKKAAMAFFRPGVTGAERVAMVDPSYVQHNPRFKKFAVDNKLSDYEGFKAMLAQIAQPPAAAAPPAAQPAAPVPPAGDPFAVVTAECDLVTIVHKAYRQDPTAAPGTWFEAFTFDTFRVKNGKLVEHWDDQVIAPPAR